MPGDPASDTTSATPSERLLTFLADQDVACPRCDYNLRGCRSSTFPECGTALALRGSPAQPRIAAYVLAVGAMAFGAGGSLVFGSIAALQAPPSWWAGASAKFMLASLAVSGVGLGLSLTFRRAFLRRGAAARWTIAIAAALIVGLLSLGSVVFFDD
ncbi:MAG: hypothetical protein AAF586_08775 [Planctomycetota bacterium]